MRAKEFLRRRGVPFREVDVAVDPAAAREMVRRSGQMGVPVIAAGDEVVVGFDRPRLESIAARYAAAPPRLGLLARDRPGGGVEVGGTRPGSPAERAGFRAGDYVEAVDGRPVRSLAHLTALTRELGRRLLLVTVRRGGQAVQLTLQ